MALTTNPSYKGQNANVANAITSDALTVSTGDLLVVAVLYEDNGYVTSQTVSNNGSAITWTQIQDTNTTGNCRVVLYKGIAGATPPTTVTVTPTAGSLQDCSKSIFVAVNSGQHATDPVPTAKIYSGAGGTDVTQSITPSATGSALYFIAADWTAGNTFSPATNCTTIGTHHETGRYTGIAIRPTTQPRTDASAFTIGESDTNGTIAWVAFEIQAAATNDTALAGGATDVATATGGLTTGIQAAGAATDNATATGGLSTGIPLQGSAAAAATTQAGIDTGIALSGAATDVSSVAGSIDTGIPLGGAATDVATAAGGIDTSTTMQGAAACVSMMTGGLTTGIPLSGSVANTVSATGALSVTSSVQSIWPSNPTPATPNVSGSEITLGTKFKATVDGQITGIRFYKATSDSATSHTIALYDNSGTLLASIATTGETSNGWQQMSFSSPVSISANATYVAAYFSPIGYYAVTGAYFSSSGVTSGDLYAYATGEVSVGNGVYTEGLALAFPNSTFNGNCYFVDVLFQSGGTAAALAVNATDTATASGTLSTGINAAVAAQDVATASAGLDTGIPLAGQVVDVSTAQGDLTAGSGLTGSATDVASATAGMTTQIQVAGGAVDTVTASGALGSGIPLTGIAAAVAAATGNLTTWNGQVTLSWTISSDTSVTGYFLHYDTTSHSGGVWSDYANHIDVSGRTTDTYTITGLELGRLYYFNITSHGAGGHDEFESELWGEVSFTAYAVVGLEGAAVVVVTAGGDLTSGISLAGAATGVSTAQGALLTSIDMASSAFAVSNAQGSLTAQIVLVGAATGVATAAADLTTAGGFASSATAVSSATGDLTTAIQTAGAATAVVTATGTLQGQAALAGAASANATATGTLAGTTLAQADIDAIAAAVWSTALETFTAEEMMRIMFAALSGKRAGIGTATETYYGVDEVTARITLTPDSNGNGTPVRNGAP